MRPTNVIMVATLSKDKLEEYHQLFKAYPHLECKAIEELVFNAQHLSDVESGKTYQENAYNKGRIAQLGGKYPTISDDSGLEVDALGGKPGVRSHRYAMPRAGETQDMANNKKLLQELSGVPKEKRTARFVCTICFFVEGVQLSTTGTLEGTILEAPRGNQGFGYDPLFVPKGHDRTLAEMSMDEKNKLSHRALAFHDLMKQIKEKNVALVRP